MLYFFALSISRTNFAKTRTLLNSELSDETQRCEHSNESSRLTYCNGTVYVAAEIVNFLKICLILAREGEYNSNENKHLLKFPCVLSLIFSLVE